MLYCLIAVHIASENRYHRFLNLLCELVFYLFAFIRVYVNQCRYMCVTSVCGSPRTAMGVGTCLLPCLKKRLCATANCLWASRGSPVCASCLLWGCWVPDVHVCSWLYVGSAGANPGLHTCGQALHPLSYLSLTMWLLLYELIFTYCPFSCCMLVAAGYICADIPCCLFYLTPSVQKFIFFNSGRNFFKCYFVMNFLFSFDM